VVHMASSWRSCEDEVEDGWVNAMGCIGLFYPKFVVFIVLGHKGSLVISFSTNRAQGLVERIKHSTIPLPPSSHSCFLRGVGVLHGVREVKRGSERSLQSSKEWDDILAVSTPYKLLICINISVLLDLILSYLVLSCFSFL
jgi:hypothetical protein